MYYDYEEDYEEDFGYEDYDDLEVNRIVAERHAKEDEENEKRAEEDPDYALYLQQVRMMEGE